MYWLIPCCARRARGPATDKLGSWAWYNVFAFVRFFQSIAGLVMVGMYAQGIDLSNITDVMQLYTVAVGAICAATGGFLTWPWMIPAYTFVWDFILAVNNIIVFATWAKAHAGQSDPGLVDLSDKDTQMHHAVYVDAASMALWTITAAYTLYKFWKRRSMLKNMPGPSEI